MNPTNDPAIIRPRLADGVYISRHALVTGDVEIGRDSSIWHMTVIRGDRALIALGARTNIQDGSILHADPDAPLTIGDDVSVGHAAIIHGCTIESNVLVGMGAVILNHAVIGTGSLVAARALVTEGMIVPPNSLVVGIPARIKPLDPHHAERIMRTAQNYVNLKNEYLAGLRDEG